MARPGAKKGYWWPLLALLTVLLPGCSSFLPNAGPSRMAVGSPTAPPPGLEVVDVDASVTQALQAHIKKPTLAPLMGECRSGGQRIGPGDVLSITIWETPPAALFSTAATQTLTGSGIQVSTMPTSLPDQQVSKEGTVSVPFAGQVPVANKTLPEIEKNIHDRLAGKTHDPQIMVRLSANVSSTVTVVGEVNQSRIVPLSPRCDRLLDMLAAAGGVKQATNKTLIQLTREGKVYTVALDDVIRDNRENIYAEPGDVVTALYKPLSFTALGATDKNAEVEFEATGINLAQALARAGGLIGTQADAAGVFLFRFESPEALPSWPTPPQLTPEGLVPVVYRIDLLKPETLFAARAFPIRDQDILYVATAPSVQFSKFLQLIGSVTSPALSSWSQVRTLSRPY